MTFGSILVIESYVALSSKNISLVGPLYPLDQLLIVLKSMQDSDLNKRITLLLTTTCTEVNPTIWVWARNVLDKKLNISDLLAVFTFLKQSYDCLVAVRQVVIIQKMLWCPSLKWLPALFGPKYSLCLAQKKRAAGHNAHSRGLKAWYNPGKGSKRCSSADSLPLRWKIDISGRSTFDHILTVIANSVLIKKLTMMEEAAERWFTTLVIVSIILWENNCSCYNVLE